MRMRYLFGPVTADFAADKLKAARDAGDCLAFNATGDADLVVSPEDTWETIRERFPAGWDADFAVLYLPYTTIPAGLWKASVPLVGLAGDWNLLWHYYRRRLPQCELVLTDAKGVETLNRAGIQHARQAVLHGCGRSISEGPWPPVPRDTDVLFVGNFNAAVQHERIPWLARLANWSEKRNIVLASGVFGSSYRQLLARSRIVFNRSIRGECNMHVFEAAAAGALLFQEEGNLEVPTFFRDRQECVYYTEYNLESLLEHYLDHEDERRTIADAAQAKLGDFTFERFWEAQVGLIEAEWNGMIERGKTRPIPSAEEELLTRTWQALGDTSDPTLLSDLRAAVEAMPRSAALHNALGIVTARRDTQLAATHFHRATVEHPDSVLFRLNLVEALIACRADKDAVGHAHQALETLHRAPQRQTWDAPHFPPVFDEFRTEWERIAFEQAGRSSDESARKRDLVRSRLHLILAEVTGDVSHWYEAALAWPHSAVTHAALGCAVARAGRPREAITHLRRALAANPFDANAARALAAALSEVGDESGQKKLARERRRLARSAPTLVRMEPWFANESPVGDELVSIIILCCNELDVTRLCMDSVLQHTRKPYELIMVDNGSSDGTPAYLEELRARPGPNRVEVIRNEQNLGFPVGCNQGLVRARGDYVIFLNNDTIVSEAWADQLVHCAISRWPHIGLVGAVSNYVPPPQQVAPGYANLDGLPAFAARRRREWAGKAMPVDRISGFCLLAPRQVLALVKGFDETFGLGFFDDDDLCLRVKQAGFQAVVALDVYVHHFGSRTFIGLGIDCQQQLKDNLEVFREKWGSERASRYHLPDEAQATPEPSREIARPTVSLCMIVKNEEDNLAACLGPVADLVDEMIVVDTGSTDRTKGIATELGARVFDFPWVDSFAAARNESLRHASSDWIFWMDADDRLDAENHDRLRDTFARLSDENIAHVLKCACVPPEPGGTTTIVDHIRLFRNHPQVRWEYRIHEQILPALRRTGAEIRWTDVVVQHVGYQDPALRTRKLERDIRLLRLEDADRPNDAFTLFNLGAVNQELGHITEALPLLQRSLERSHPNDSIVRKLYALLSQCHRQLGQKELSLAAALKGREFYPDDVELLFHEGLCRRDQKDMAGAEACWLRALQPKSAEHFASVDAGLAGYKTRHNLAILYQEAGRLEDAEKQWRLALVQQPGFVPGLVGLGEVFAARQQWPQLDELLPQVERLAGSIAASLLRVHRHLGRKEFADARRICEQLITSSPQAIAPRRLLTYALIQEGRDWDAAEKALHAVLEINPNEVEARNNLAVLQRQRASHSPATP